MRAIVKSITNDLVDICDFQPDDLCMENFVNTLA
jgi:hypothetical protein